MFGLVRELKSEIDLLKWDIARLKRALGYSEDREERLQSNHRDLVRYVERLQSHIDLLTEHLGVDIVKLPAYGIEKRNTVREV